MLKYLATVVLLLFKSISACAIDTCSRVEGMYVTNVTSFTATIDWEPVAGCTGYLYSVSKSVVPPARIGKFIKDNSVEVTGLGAANTYYAHVRAVCPDAQVSDWATVQFNTPAPPGKRFDMGDDIFAVTVYPSLADFSINIKAKGELEDAANVSIYDILGVKIQTYPIRGDRLHIDVARLKPGIYYVCYIDRRGRVEWMRFTK